MNITAWYKRHRIAVNRLLFVVLVGGFIAAIAGGKTYTSVVASGGSDYQARLAANRVAAKYFLAMSAMYSAVMLADDLIRRVKASR